MPQTHAPACELRRKLDTRAQPFGRASLLAALGVLTLVMVLSLWPVTAQEHSPPPAASASTERAHEGGEAHVAEGEHASPFSGLLWPTANFIIMVGVLVYFLKTPFGAYLASRSGSIRKDLVDASAIKAAATAQLAALEQKLQALPGEIEALRARGADEIAAEEQRIAAAAAAERERLLEQTRHEIDLQLRLAKREILEHAAELSVQLATERLKTEITPADQAALVDRYINQVKAPPAPSPKPQA